jgi:hypothetical protein
VLLDRALQCELKILPPLAQGASARHASQTTAAHLLIPELSEVPRILMSAMALIKELVMTL